MSRPTRDMTWVQFKAAAKRQGFTPAVVGLADDEANGTIYGYVMWKRDGEWRIHHRHSLARAVQGREEGCERLKAPRIIADPKVSP